MAKDNDSNPFVDMFARFGQQMNVPSVDVDRILDHHRKNLEALQKSAQAAAGGANQIMARQREMLEETLADFSEMAQSFRSPGNPQEFMSRQAEFARKSFETAVRNATEMGEMVRKSGTDSIEVLRERIRDGMEEIRGAYDKRK